MANLPRDLIIMFACSVYLVEHATTVNWMIGEIQKLFGG